MKTHTRLQPGALGFFNESTACGHLADHTSCDTHSVPQLVRCEVVTLRLNRNWLL